MEKNNKTLLIAVLIMLLALVSLNFNNISGKATNSGDVRVTVSPAVVAAGGIVNVFVDAGVSIDSRAYLYKANGARVGGETERVCSGSLCSGVNRFKFRVSRNVAPGKYYIGVDGKGSSSMTYKSNMFSVR